MIRRAAAIILALTLNPALLHAQDTVITVSVASANVHKGPSTASPIIGQASRGAVLPVSRNLGSWVKVSWPIAPDGIGYVHVSMGRVGPPVSAAAAASATAPRTASAAAAASAATPAATTIQMETRTSVGEPVVSRRSLNMTPASHILGVGGLIGTSSEFGNNFGATARAWRTTHLGIQLGFTRDAMTSSLASGRVTSMQFEPGVIYGIADRVTDYIWFRPYVGSVVSFQHQTLNVAAPVPVASISDNGLGFKIFGGSELMFASMPRFGVSLDLGYRKYPTPFPGFEADPMSLSFAGHWYIK